MDTSLAFTSSKICQLIFEIIKSNALISFQEAQDPVVKA